MMIVDSMDTIMLAEEFLNEHYRTEIFTEIIKIERQLTIDFNLISKFDVNLAEMLLTEPEETIKAFEVAVSQFDIGKLPQDFKVRVKHIPAVNKVPINEVRATQHLFQLIKVEGIVKQKSDVKANIRTGRFECPGCGTIISVLQLDERKFKEPTKCGCGRKGHFKLISSEKIDVYSLALEEPTDLISGGTKLARVRVVCQAGLTIPKIERKIYQGVRVEISGVLKEFQIIKQNVMTSKVDWYLDANHIEIFDESFMDLKWTKKDVDEFQAIANDRSWLKILRKSIFYDIQGYEEECEAIVLQMFGGVGIEREGAHIRGNYHILLVGDPGNAKSTMLKIAQRFAPKAMYQAGTGISGVGLSAGVVKDDLLGGYTLEAGVLVLCNNGLLCLDELDKIEDAHKKSLHEPLSENTVSISKANIKETLIAKTSVLAAANPKHGSYSEYNTVYSQIDLTSSLINRFDLIYPIKESKLTSKDDYNIAMKILGRGTNEEKELPEYPKDFIKKYIAYAKTINPQMPVNIQKYIADKYMKLKEKKREMNEAGKDAIPISGRNVDALRRVIEAIARSRLHEEITKDDAEIGYRKMIYSIEQVGIDPESGDVVEEFAGGKFIKKKDLLARLLHIITEHTKGTGETIKGDEIYAIMEHEGITDQLKVDETLEHLKKNGDIFEPVHNHYKVP